MNILITGASSGIGRGLAVSYAAAGHNVIAIGRNKIALDELAILGISCIQLDLVNLDAVREQSALLNKTLNNLDLAILNAGNCEYLDISSFDAALIKRVFDANVISFANSLELVLPLLRKSRNPHLVGVASIAGYLPLSRAEAYGASKAAIIYLLDTLAIDLAKENILVTTVNPGFVKTPLTAKNNFPMPFAIDVNAATRIIQRGIEQKKIEIHFPYRLTLVIKLLGLLPRRWWRYLGKFLVR